MNRKKLVRAIAIVLAILLAGSAVVSAVISIAYAEEAPARNRMTLTMEYLEEAQALRVSQRLVYTNGSGRALDRALFYLPANLLRRADSLPYEGDALLEALPEDYLPGGVELTSVAANGEAADWGFQGEDEMYLRVACDIAPGASVEFEFDYYLLLSENAAFLGVSDDGWRLSGFYFAPASLDAQGEFILNPPLSFTDYADTPRMDVEAEITLPESCLLAATGEERIEGDGTATEGAQEGEGVDVPGDAVSLARGEAGASDGERWAISAEDVRSFALTFGKRYREYAREAGGVELRCLTNVRGVADELLDVAATAVERCEAWLGPFPCAQLDLAQADVAGGSLASPGCLWLSEALLRDADGRDRAVRAFVARQYLGERACARPVSDAWLSDALCEYLAYLLLEDAEGHDAYLAALNERVVPALQLTLPGGLDVTSDASLFTAEEYETIVLDRGAAALHELRTAMGEDALLAGLRLFYERGLRADRLTERDLTDALRDATGRDWAPYLTDCLHHIDEYVDQSIDWLD